MKYTYYPPVFPAEESYYFGSLICRTVVNYYQLPVYKSLFEDAV